MSAQAILFDAPGPKTRQRHLIWTALGSLFVFGVAAGVLWILWDKGQITPDKWAPIFTFAAWKQYFVPGIQATLVAALVAIVASFALGLILAMGRMSDLRVLRIICTVVIEFFRAVPVLIMMLFVFFMLVYTFRMRGGTAPFLGVVVGLICYNGAVIAEVVRNGVASLPKGQREAGLSIGLSSSEVRRMILVPQALTAMMPTLVSQVVVILKDTALGYIILYPELLNSVRQMGSRFGNMTVAFTAGAVAFIFLNWCISKVAEWLERRLQRRGHTAGRIAEAEPGDVD
ncbi:MAG TPA: amino acid ABC transporter permease [Propionibacterium sp.]|nr:amino acid ABC transporter permease [Propionibacterium sp.]